MATVSDRALTVVAFQPFTVPLWNHGISHRHAFHTWTAFALSIVTNVVCCVGLICSRGSSFNAGCDRATRKSSALR